MRANLTAQGVSVITERLFFRPFVDDTRGIVEQLNVCVISKTKTHTCRPAMLLSKLVYLHCIAHVCMCLCGRLRVYMLAFQRLAQACSRMMQHLLVI